MVSSGKRATMILEQATAEEVEVADKHFSEFQPQKRASEVGN